MNLIGIYLFWLIPSIIMGCMLFREELAEISCLRDITRNMKACDIVLLVCICLGSFVSIIMILFAFLCYLAVYWYKKIGYGRR